MTAALQMETRARFGFSNRATLNAALFDALRASLTLCETCRDIERAIDALPVGGEFVESGSFPGKTVQKLDAHFKTHWKNDYILRDLSGRKDPV